eukprot:2723877-Pleurochrysis_carterae.AAC.1
MPPVMPRYRLWLLFGCFSGYSAWARRSFATFGLTVAYGARLQGPVGQQLQRYHSYQPRCCTVAREAVSSSTTCIGRRPIVQHYISPN